MTKTSVVKINNVKGVRPDFDVYIGRYVRFQEFKQSKWANPFTINNAFLDEILESYEARMRSKIELFPKIYDLNELKGKKLGCWCVTSDEIYPMVCHGQVLMKLIEEMM